MKKRILSLALTLIICLGLAVPASAYDMAKVGKVNVVSAGGYHTGLIDKNGSLWMWGLYKPVGNGRSKLVTVPTKVLDNVISVSSGSSHTAALKTDGSMWWWGYFGVVSNSNGVSETYYAEPVKVLENVAAVSCGGSHTAALKTDGSLWMSAGNNDWGQLGDSSSKEGRPPADPIKVLDNVATVSCGGGHTAAVKTDGSLWVWGDNSSGELGLSSVNSSLPFQTPDGKGGALNGSQPIQTVPAKLTDSVAAVSGGNGFTIIIKKDGSVWACGANDVGQLGNGGKHNSTVFGGQAIQTTLVKLPNLTGKLK